MQLPLIVLVGPTASGKSELAIRLAESLIAAGRPAEIVNADSMLIYRGMDIGTAKPGPDELARVPHHLVDIVDVRWSATVAEIQQLARQAIAGLRAQGVIPILVGGSALYIRAILDHFEFPGTDPLVRARWQAELDRLGPQLLHAELAARAPGVAAGILPGNGRRIVRALEVLELTGDFTARLPQPGYELSGVEQFGIRLPRELLDQRIAERVDRMWRCGLVDEVRGLEAAGLREGPTASRALGYRQVLDFLDGRLDEQQARQATITATRRFARRQLSWFRRDPRIRWLDAEQGDPLAQLLSDPALVEGPGGSSEGARPEQAPAGGRIDS